MNLPNKITLLRIVLIPAFLVVYLMQPFGEDLNAWLALIIFSVAAATDALDGYLARRLKLISNFGKLMDPLADKLLVAAALVAFAAMGDLSVWVAIIIISREFYISGLRQLALEQNIVMAADLLGKLKTVFQIVLIIYVLLPLQFLVFTPVTIALAIIAVVFTIWSAVDYTLKNKQVFRSK